jgi:ubiquitin-conjugating enzyme E2 Q
MKESMFGGKFFKFSGQKEDPIDLVDDDDDDAVSIATLQEDIDILMDDDAITEPEEARNGKGVLKAPEISMTDFVPGTLDHSTLPKLDPPSWATTSATKRLQQDFKSLLKVQQREPLWELGWYIDPELITNMYQWIVELHSFEPHLPLAKDMKKRGITSIVLELRFGKDYPMSPPFVRVVRPRFLGFLQGGGGHVTAGGALCMELLTNDGWSAVSSIESVLLQVRLAISSTDPRPARLAIGGASEYGVWEAVEAYQRACRTHGWTIPPGFQEMAFGGQPSSASL